MSPRGAPLTQARVAELAARSRRGRPVRPVRGRRRARDRGARTSRRSRVGDYVLSGGEIAALALIDACVRLFPASWARRPPARRKASPQGLLEYPQYTRPQLFEGRADPGGAHLRRPRQDRGLAARRGRTAHPRAPAGPLGGLSGALRTTEECRPERVTKPDLCRRSSPTRIDHMTIARLATWRCRRRIPMNLIQQLEKEQIDKAHRRQGNPGFRARRHRHRQRQGGRGRAHPRPGL